MFGRTALAARESGIADALSYSCGVGFAVRFYGGWRRLAQTRLVDRCEQEPSPCRARTLLAPLALDADLMLKKKLLQ